MACGRRGVFGGPRFALRILHTRKNLAGMRSLRLVLPRRVGSNRRVFRLEGASL
jgi:hypothetical protein